MSIDIFGRNLKQSEGKRGPPGISYKLTNDGNYDLENKRICNLVSLNELSDAVNLRTLQQIIREEIKKFLQKCLDSK